MEKEVALVQPIGKAWPVRRVGPVRLHKRRMYKPKVKGRLFFDEDEDENKDEDDSAIAEGTSARKISVNHACSAPEGVGGHIDFKA